MSASAQPCYADHLTFRQVEVECNEHVARDTYKLRFRCPEMAERFRPGQFLMVRLAGVEDPLIGRPFAMFDRVDGAGGSAESIDFIYLVGGKLTSRLCNYRPGQLIEVWGPLGNGFPVVDTERLILVAGGIGQTPFLTVAREFLGQQQYGRLPTATGPRSVTLCYGARTKEYFAGLDQFRAAGIDVHLSTDDGSLGRHGFVTQLLEEHLAASVGQTRHVMCCGPEPMMRAVAGITKEHGVNAHVSLETPMACGIGICFSCVALVADEQGNPDYRRTCVEGPVFDAHQLIWE